MAEDNTAGAAQAATLVATPTQAVTTPSTDAQAAKSSEDYERMIAELRKENASHRTKLKIVEDAEAARQLAALSDAEKLQARADKAEKQIKDYQQQLVNAHVKLAAQAKGIIDPDLAALAVAQSLEYGDDGMPSNLDKALDDLIKNKPFLVAHADGTQPASPARTAPATPAMNPGRSSINPPGALPQGQRMTFHDLYGRNK